MGKHIYWISSVLITLALRAWLLFSAAVPFNGDEAVVALMARHITQGAKPLFFYGQAYMGSLDAILIAAGFELFGEAIWVIRLVQILLYCAFLFTGWLLARRLLQDARSAGMAVLLMAVPPVMVATYTSATLGGYGETLVFGNLILFLGYEVVFGNWKDRWEAWIGLGLISGIAFWTLGLSGVYMLPVVVVGLMNFRKLKPVHILFAAAAFFVGSLPWWLENFTNNWQAFAFLLGESELKLPLPSPFERLIGYFFLGIPTLFGLRRPWEGFFEPLWMVVIGVVLMLALLIFIIEVRRRKLSIWKPGAAGLLAWMVAGFTVIFIGTQFSIDSTGRYFIPLYPVVSIGFGGLAGWIAKKSLRGGWGLVVLVLLFNFLGVYRAASEVEGLTTQFASITRFNNDYDQQLMVFLEENNLSRGYSNYWVTFRIAFLSNETLIFSPRLPYKEDLSYTTHDNRYPFYDELLHNSEAVAYITTLHPVLDQQLTEGFSRIGITFEDTYIGPFHVFYELSMAVQPEDLLNFQRP